jgi:hypothetical protein
LISCADTSPSLLRTTACYAAICRRTWSCTRKRIRRGAFKSVAELKGAMMEYLENHNADPKPFIWTKSASQILEKVARAKQALESQH